MCVGGRAAESQGFHWLSVNATADGNIAESSRWQEWTGEDHMDAQTRGCRLELPYEMLVILDVSTAAVRLLKINQTC